MLPEDAIGYGFTLGIQSSKSSKKNNEHCLQEISTNTLDTKILLVVYSTCQHSQVEN